MPRSKSKADIAIAKLVDRLKGTSVGWVLPTLRIDSKSVANYMRTHKDVQQAVDLWLEDIKRLMEEEGDG